MATHSLPSSVPAGFWSKAYNITSEEADKVVANATAVNRSVKPIPNNSPWFLVILTIIMDIPIFIITPEQEIKQLVTHI